MVIDHARVANEFIAGGNYPNRRWIINPLMKSTGFGMRGVWVSVFIKEMSGTRPADIVQ